MKLIGCKDVGIDCLWTSRAESEDEVLDAISNHAIAEHQVWLEDGPIQMWSSVRAKIRDDEAASQPASEA